MTGTARVKAVFKPSDYPGTPDAATKKALGDLFAEMFPGNPTPEIDGPHTAMAVAAQNPELARHLNKVSAHFIREVPWTQRKDLRELAIQVLNLHWKCDFSFQAHLGYAKTYGISAEQQAALPYWRTTNIFNDEQRLVIEYSFAVCEGNVSDELFARVVKAHGEKGAVEFTGVIAWWSFWAMFINATGCQFDYGHGPKGAP